MENLDVDIIILKWALKKSVGRAWIGFIWLRTEISGRLF